MAIGTSITQNNNTTFLKLLSKGGARFGIQEKNSEGKYEIVKQTKIVNGALESLEVTEWQFEGNAIYTIKIKLVDKDENYIVSINPETGLWRNAVASFLSLEEYGHILELSLYNKKYTDKKWLPAVSDNIGINYNGEMLKWKYPMQDKTEESGLPAVGTKKVKADILPDYYERDMALIALLQDHIAWLPKATKLDDMPTGIESKSDDFTDSDTITEEDVTEVFTESKTKNTPKDMSDKPFK